MKNILHIILVSIISLTVISCSSDDSKTTDNTCTSSDVSFLAVGASGTLLTSADGTCWTAQTSGTTNNLRAFAIKPSTIGVVVGYSGTILTTTDGITWTSRTSGTSNDINNVHYNSAGFVAVGDSGTLLTSSDGITWTDKTSSCGMTENLWGISSNSTVAVAVGDNGSIYTSADAGDNCTKRTSGTTSEFNGLLYGNSTFVAVGYSGTLLTSDNGTTWTSKTSGTSNEIREVIYDRNIFFGVGEDATYIYSQNGTSWSSGSPTGIDASAYLSGVAYGLETWVTVGASGVIYTIKDEGTAYTLRTSGTTEHLRRVYSLVE